MEEQRARDTNYWKMRTKTVISGISHLMIDAAQSNPFFACVAMAIIAAGSILMYLIVKSSDEFSVEETEKNADEFAGIIKIPTDQPKKTPHNKSPQTL